MNNIYYVRKDRQVILTEQEYLDLLAREAQDLWKNKSEEEQEEFGSFEEFKTWLNEQDQDFVRCTKDENGDYVDYNTGEPIGF